jgi:uncharacterized protein YbjQ (UPF0145 family)
MDLVTAQSNLGTGIAIGFVSDMSDLFGMQSGSYKNKMSEVERLYKVGLISKALEMHADAIIGIDIDYQEVGGGKGILMVCMTGTAVKLIDFKVLFQISIEKLNNTKKHYAELLELRTLGDSFQQLFNPYVQTNPSGFTGQFSH